MEGQLGRIKEISRSKTGKHGSCKLTIKCANVMKSNKTLMYMCTSQDDVSVFEPPQTAWRLAACDPREGTALLKGDQGAELLLTPDKETLAALRQALQEQEEEGDEEPLECTVLSWAGKHVVLRTAKQKALKRR